MTRKEDDFRRKVSLQQEASGVGTVSFLESCA